MLRAVKIRLYPNKEQATMFNMYMVNLFFAIVASNWICIKLDNKYDSANN